MDKQFEVRFHDEFLPEFRKFPDSVRLQIYSLIEMLTVFGPMLGRPHVDTLKGSDYPNMKELRFRAENGVAAPHVGHYRMRASVRVLQFDAVFFAGTPAIAVTCAT